MPLVQVEVDPKSLQLLLHALNDEADGRELKRDLAVNLSSVAQTARLAAQGAILTMPSPMATTRGPGLRSVVASQTKVQVRLYGRSPGVTIRTMKTGMPRSFPNAPKRLNARGGWRHTVFGDNGEVVRQVGKPGWFDDTIARHRPAFVRAAGKAMDEMALRISLKTRG